MKSKAERVRKRIQRTCDCAAGGCARCGGAQRTPRGEAPAAVPQAAYEVLRSPGEPLDAAVRREHESKLGHDLGEIRVHAAPSETAAGTAVDEMNAYAFTIGRHIVMADDAPHPSGPDGRELLGHELRHAVEHQARFDPKVESVGMLDMQPTDSADERDAARTGSYSDEEAAAVDAAGSDTTTPVDQAETEAPAQPGLDEAAAEAESMVPEPEFVDEAHGPEPAPEVADPQAALAESAPVDTAADLPTIEGQTTEALP